ncbi:hypothetical protein PENANT_c006G09296 [Penicillium antarcticum]|uniref:Uncharacterized protein n=1 Tax=Penicillium antarcticum TaxID=416450 RepID=A0A1V6QD66_9EURO|nr:uncharacterized protein N7508_009487 [Penicillium antarcticum]KAJ5294666.1 hypothetical protein N7508_009487 [Penicillium antarcticum]OQD87151.1 hypothetical protein PENANT_c006G09296 [Penicillium antarcticum]
MESTAQTSADADENMRLAVERFRTKMEASNRQFLQDRIDEIEAKNLSTEEEKLEKMDVYWSSLGIKSNDPWMATAPPEIVRQAREEENVTRLADYSSLYHHQMDGVRPPKLRTDEWRQMYLDTVQKVCNGVAFRDEADNDFEVLPCHELAIFLKYASEIVDPDFRYAGMAHFQPPGALSKETSDISKDREDLTADLRRYYLWDESFVEAYKHDDLEVRVGFKTGNGVKYKLGRHDIWYSMYLYCRRDEEDSDQSHKYWAWRVVVSHATICDNPMTVYGQKPRFDSIVEFLDWYSSWLEHLDMDKIREDVHLNCSDEWDPAPLDWADT